MVRPLFSSLLQKKNVYNTNKNKENLNTGRPITANIPFLEFLVSAIQMGYYY